MPSSARSSVSHIFLFCNQATKEATQWENTVLQTSDQKHCQWLLSALHLNANVRTCSMYTDFKGYANPKGNSWFASFPSFFGISLNTYLFENGLLGSALRAKVIDPRMNEEKAIRTACSIYWIPELLEPIPNGRDDM